MRLPTKYISIGWLLITAFMYHSPAQTWKAGVAKNTITPQDSVWMAGYASRTHHAGGTLHNLWVKALALEDSLGNRALLLTTDLLGTPRNLSKSICDRLMQSLNLERSQIILSSSHTHSGPVLRQSLYPAYSLDEKRIDQIDAYSSWLEDQVVRTGVSAFNNLQPVSITSGRGTVRFGVNRRNNIESQLETATELAGPIDHSVPVLAIQATGQSLLAILFGYACHATVLSTYQWSGDYPGFAQLAIEEAFPGSVAMFFAGAGGDINPLPRRSVGLAQQYGEELASAVKRVIHEELHPLSPQLFTAYDEIELAYDSIPGSPYLKRLIEAENTNFYERKWAEGLNEKLQQGQAVGNSYTNYPVQTWFLGEQKLVALGGEVVVDYAIRLKRLLGQDIFVMAYANDVMAYIPSLRILREGGYEGFLSSRVYDLPGPWAPIIEETIIQAVYTQVKGM